MCTEEVDMKAAAGIHIHFSESDSHVTYVVELDLETDSDIYFI